jgi:hypothetical protein
MLGKAAVRSIAGIASLMVIAALAALPQAAAADFQLGIEDPEFSQPLGSPGSTFAYNTLHAAHATTVRLVVSWSDIAPIGSTVPAGFDGSNPADPHYRWNVLDQAVRAAAAEGAHVILDLTGAPPWAIPAGKPAPLAGYTGVWDPNAAEFGAFARAVALRYSGQFPDPQQPGKALPREKYFEIWNEENLPGDLTAPDPVEEYRALLNASYSAIKSIHSDNVVAIGGLAPVGDVQFSLPPLKFAAQLLCLRRIQTHYVKSKSCPAKAQFDVFAIHPYSLASTPTKHADNYDDVLVGDMGKVRSLLKASERLHTASPNIKYGLWVTEWSWFSNPPNPVFGETDPVAARYTAYGLYELWRSGTSLVVWLLINYTPAFLNAPPAGRYGGALYTRTGQPTLKMQAFEFPVIASVNHGRGYVWGRAPAGGHAKVLIQRKQGKGWKTLGSARTASDGVFQFHFGAHGNGTYRASVNGGPVSLGYFSAPIPPKRTKAFSAAADRSGSPRR